MTKDIEPQLSKLQPTRQGSWLTQLLPQINELISIGVLRATIVTHLREQGFDLNLDQLDKALYRWRKRQNANTPNQAQRLITSQAQSGPIRSSALPLASSPPDAADITSKSDLTKLRNTETPDLNSLAALARQHRKENKA